MASGMRFDVEFTAAARRALDAAGRWSSLSEGGTIGPPALLLGLLGQHECHAADVLRRHGVTMDTILSRWPNLRAAEDHGLAVHFDAATAEATNWLFSADVQASVDRAAEWLAEHGQPVELATEHLLLGLVSGPHEVAQWLGGHGIDAKTVEKELYCLHGHLPRWAAGGENPPIGEPIEMERVQEPVGVFAGGQPGDAREDVSTPAARMDASGLLRLIDAAANRAHEGLRVVEDYVRFVLDDGHLTELLKRFRHELTGVLAPVTIESRLAARETQADVGTRFSTEAEGRRERPEDVLAANFCRLQESLRSLEEYVKLVDRPAAAVLEQLRYRSYTLQRAVSITRHSAEWLVEARLYVLLDGRDSAEEFETLAGRLVGAGVDVLQLRDKRLDDRALLDRARRLREITRGSGTLLVMNDRPDLALLAGADGVHVGQEELSVKDVRALVGPGMLIGVSTHSIEQARAAVLDGADYLGVGPTFPSGTKAFERFPGLELVRAVAAEIRLPAFAIGGIGRDRVPEVLATGMRRIAVSGAVIDAEDPAAAAAELKAMVAGE